MENVFFYNYPIGTVGIAEKDGKISRLFFGDRTPDGCAIEETAILKKASAQLSKYFEGRRAVFELPLHMEETGFRLSVLNALAAIPYGETKTYKQIAEITGNPKAARAVGTACNQNPIAIIIPCHRVIGSNGKLTGYAGGLSVKQYLLEIERRAR